MERKAKIIATIGPSSQDIHTLEKMILAGMNVARLNFSHGQQEEHKQKILTIRQLSQSLGKPITILQDLQGPKLRVGLLPKTGIKLFKDDMIVLHSTENTEQPETSTTYVPMDVPNLINSVQPGKHILMDDGKIEVVVTEIRDNHIQAKVLQGGVLNSQKGVNLPGVKLDLPSLTPKDLNDLRFGLENDVDIIAVSFIKKAKDIQLVRETIQKNQPSKIDIPIIAKLERPEAIENLLEIIQTFDGVMVARGDLAVETSTELVPILQKQIIKTANRHSKIVITATQMLESMIDNPRPTRAEASDVANAIFDGSDAVMLSEETASGNFPVESIAMMDRIILQAERHFYDWGIHKDREASTDDDAISITRAARELAHDRNVAGIVVFTQHGKTALLMSKARPHVPILALTPNLDTYQKLGILWGITPLMASFSDTIETLLANVDATLTAFTTIKPDQQVVVISGYPFTKVHSPNFVLLHSIESNSE